MCLLSVDKETKQVIEGWKVIKAINNKLHGICYPFNFETNRWITDLADSFIKSDSNKKYQAGFHFYLNKEDAELDVKIWNNVDDKVFKVRVKNVVATGTQLINIHNKLTLCKVGVAREIFIEEE